MAKIDIIKEFKNHESVLMAEGAEAVLEIRAATEPSLAYEANGIAEKKYQLQLCTDPDKANQMARELADAQAIAADIHHPLRFNHRAAMCILQRKLHSIAETLISKALDFEKQELAALDKNLAEVYAGYDEPAPTNTPMHARIRMLGDTALTWRSWIEKQRLLAGHFIVTIGQFADLFALTEIPAKPRFVTADDEVRRRASKLGVEEQRSEAERERLRKIELDKRAKEGNSRVKRFIRHRREKQEAAARAQKFSGPGPVPVEPPAVTVSDARLNASEQAIAIHGEETLPTWEGGEEVNTGTN